MLRQGRLLAGISIFWLALSMLFDGINTLVLPFQLSTLTDGQSQATALGLLTFIGLMAGALIQPIAGSVSDRYRTMVGRKGMVGIGVLLSLASLAFFILSNNLTAIAISYLAIQVSGNVAQAGQQGLLPDLVQDRRRGLASGLKGFMDIGGAMLGFVFLGQLLGSGRPSLAVGVIAVILLLTYLAATLLTPEDRPGNQIIPHRRIGLKQIFQIDPTREKDFIRLLIARFLFLLGIYATGRFLLFFVAERLGLETNQAAEQAGRLLAALALITVLASPIAGWLADRAGRLRLMVTGSVLGAISALLLVWADNSSRILLFGGLMSIGSAAFAGGSWALIADLAPKDESARYFGLANFSTVGAAACAGLFGPVIDWVERVSPGNGYSILFIGAALAFLASAIPVKNRLLKEVKDVRERNRNKGKDRADASRLAVLSLSTHPSSAEEDTHPSGGSTRL
ncbi:MAG TPA: MFS transporter [Anaerolineales bacterium]|nr:MFS transporter [Anaerolineales bacterium]